MILGVLQARVSSSRLPGKVLLDLHGAPMIVRQIERVRRARLLDQLVVATSTSPEDDVLAAMCKEQGIACVRGSLCDVLSRVVLAARAYNPDWVVRITGDCPLADPAVIDAVIGFAIEQKADYASNAVQPTYPDGLDVEVVRMSVLEQAAAEAKLTSEREHVTPFIHKRPDRFRVSHFQGATDLSGLRWTVDEVEDLEFVRAVYAALYDHNPIFSTADVLALLAERPELGRINASFARNEGYLKSLAADKQGAGPR
jgi:spore coat polysaccharide biosynthesis protein SpsF